MQLFEFKREHLPAMIAVIIVGVVVISYFFGAFNHSSPTSENSQKMTDEDKMKILQGLQAQGSGSSTQTTAEKKATLNGLSGSSDGYQYSEQGKLQILESLQKNQTSQ